MSDSGGTGFWHETYVVRGGMKAIYDDVAKPIGTLKFAAAGPAAGPLFSARSRAGRRGQAAGDPAVAEAELAT